MASPSPTYLSSTIEKGKSENLGSVTSMTSPPPPPLCPNPKCDDWNCSYSHPILKAPSILSPSPPPKNPRRDSQNASNFRRQFNGDQSFHSPPHSHRQHSNFRPNSRGKWRGPPPERRPPPPPRPMPPPQSYRREPRFEVSDLRQALEETESDKNGVWVVPREINFGFIEADATGIATRTLTIDYEGYASDGIYLLDADFSSLLFGDWKQRECECVPHVTTLYISHVPFQLLDRALEPHPPTRQGQTTRPQHRVSSQRQTRALRRSNRAPIRGYTDPNPIRHHAECDSHHWQQQRRRAPQAFSYLPTADGSQGRGPAVLIRRSRRQSSETAAAREYRVEGLASPGEDTKED